MECDPALLDELKHLVQKQHTWRRNNLRTNLARSKDDIVVDGTWRKLKVGVFSNGVREGMSPTGDRMLAIVREMLPKRNGERVAAESQRRVWASQGRAELCGRVAHPLL